MKSRCCNCNHVFQGDGACPKCKSNSVEALVSRDDARKIEPRTEHQDQTGPRDLLEVPNDLDNLYG